ncbi:MAG: phoH, partial [Herbinix sp.]|nr:phoH [Herbinix sp.]
DIGFCYLTSQDVVRHPLVQKIVKAYDTYEENQKHYNTNTLEKEKHKKIMHLNYKSEKIRGNRDESR